MMKRIEVESIKVRKASPRDIPEVKQIETITGLSPWSESDYALETSREDSLFHVAVLDEAVVGFLLARLITISRLIPADLSFFYSCDIYNLAVNPSHQRQSVATRLLQELLRKIEPDHSIRLHLEVRTRNSTAVAFYKAFGFKITGVRRDFYTNPADDAFLMKYEAMAVHNPET